MKKLVAITLLLALLTSGCAAKSDPKGSITSADTEESTEPETGGTVTPTAAKPEISAPEEDATADGEIAEIAPDTPDGEPADFREDAQDNEFGRISGGIYENTYFGVGCELDSDWTFYSSEELAELNGLAASAITDEELAALVENSGVQYDMYAYAAEGLFSINVTIEKLNALYGIALTEDSYMDISMSSLETAFSSMEGAANPKIEKTTVSFAGAERSALKISFDYLVEDTAIPAYELIVCIKSGNYVAVVTFSTATEDYTDEAASLFYALEA